ncbi:hypothetical protein [Streptomyces sp. NPDC001914]|uniref:hypothetical protein n=1 Tax=Streptomyces sp. NPDC001914 TaxID=3364623 RepID=UPI0036B0B850
MSRVYFHSPSGDAELRGSERAWLSGLVNDLAIGILALHDPSRVDRLISLAAPGHYIALHADRNPNGMRLETAYRLAFLHGDPYTDALVQHRGRPVDTFTLGLNTAMLLGNDQIRLAARLHAQCELHTWVDGPNRAWLADVMEAGLESGIYRRGIQYVPDPARDRDEPQWVSQGWEDVITLLRARDDEPVVASFSVTEQFPNPGRMWQEFGESGDGWYELSAADQWQFAMDWLRQAPGNLELKPDDDPYRFGHGLTIHDLFAHDWEDRLDRALSDMGEDS